MVLKLVPLMKLGEVSITDLACGVRVVSSSAGVCCLKREVRFLMIMCKKSDLSKQLWIKLARST